jgi:phosphoribosylaminoimidazolecarboxamide formyltransferase/IMP cyclohydrolase
MESKVIRSALISVFSKEGLSEIVHELDKLGVAIYSTGGTQQYIENLHVPVTGVETLTTYPSILSGRVKTLHPKVFGGILARREKEHLTELEQYEIPEFDLVIVDLYPFEATLEQTSDENEIIEKIDIGGISLIRAAAKNYHDVTVVPSRDDYSYFLNLLREGGGTISPEARKYLASRAFQVTAHYDSAIFSYFNLQTDNLVFHRTYTHGRELRYGENPHQRGFFYGDLERCIYQLSGKTISYNNLVDIDAAIGLMREFKEDPPTFAVLKHTNPCGVATRNTVFEAWESALAGDPISAFGGILICNYKIDLSTATEINKLFYEVLIAQEFDTDALDLLSRKKKRILLKLKAYELPALQFRSLLSGIIAQDPDIRQEDAPDLRIVTTAKPDERELNDLLFANKCVKHLKSNSIAIVKNRQLIGIGCGQTSRVDACKQAIHKADQFGFEINGAVLASDAFFPFADCVQIAGDAGISAVIQPGGSINDQDSIDHCDQHNMSMAFTGVRHFKH